MNSTFKVNSNSNMSLSVLDFWYYAIGDLNGIEKLTKFEKLTNQDAIQALLDCIFLENKSACQKSKELNGEFTKNGKLITILPELLNQPTAHFLDNHSRHEAFIPFCSYVSDGLELEECKLFQPMPIKMLREQCYTFQGNEKIPTLEPSGGLNSMINFDYPGSNYDRGKPARIFLHEPGTLPDTAHIRNTYSLVDSGTVTTIKIKPTVIDETDDFNAMPIEKRNCQFTENGYTEVNCIIDKISLKAQQACGCLPWYIGKTKNQCDPIATFCFNKRVQNLAKDADFIGSCQPACKFIKYTASSVTQKPIQGVIPSLPDYGEKVENYFKKDRGSLLKQLYGYNKYFMSIYMSERLNRVSFVNINFDDPQVTVFTKDAKVTPYSMLGSIGGTLGIFLGISFVGLIDLFEVVVNGIQWWIKKWR